MSGYPIILGGDHAAFEREWAQRGRPDKERPDWPLPSWDARDWAEEFCYEWGKISRACYQLALGLLADALEDDERALMLHRAYAEEYIAKLNRDAGIMLTADTIRLDARLMESRATA